MVLRNVLLGPHTTFGIGCPASSFAGVGSSADRDANVFVDDGGFDGLAVRTADSADVEVLEDGRLRARSGVTVDRLIDVALAHGPSGLEHFAGIPSSLGGALWQDLHFLSPDRRRILSIGELVEEATVLAAAERPARAGAFAGSGRPLIESKLIVK